MEQKLVVVIMGQDCEKTIGMALESVKDADVIVYCDGGSEDNTLYIVNNFNFTGSEIGVRIIINKYNQEDKQMNGKQRNFYLDYIKKNYSDWWCLALDADEIVEDVHKIKRLIQTTDKGLYHVKMRHLVGDFGHEDATKEEHFVPNRLFKIDCADKYTEVEHSLLMAKEGFKYYGTTCTTIWHLRECLGCFEYKKKYDWNRKKSNMHTDNELYKWYHLMISGQYPRKKVELWELPKALRRKFEIGK